MDLNVSQLQSYYSCIFYTFVESAWKSLLVYFSARLLNADLVLSSGVENRSRELRLSRHAFGDSISGQS